MTANRPERGSHEPGTFFNCNNWDFNAAGTIFRQVTGQDIFVDFEKRIAKPIGMQDFDPDSCKYNYEEQHSQHPARMIKAGRLRPLHPFGRFGPLLDTVSRWFIRG